MNVGRPAEITAMPRQQHQERQWIQKATSPKTAGAFTAYAKRNHLGMAKAIQRGLRSPNAKTRHRAQFAANMRRLAAAKKH